ncbi:MAG TPA: DUF3300 domain-containing protein [Spongiibacteraceae bacterium]|nr:DUF3300 domain-containing protein [Spongiibacteraceae bacterium]
MHTFFERLARALVLAASLLAMAVAAEDAPPSFSSEQLEQLTAPIALYPDSLLSQVLMAATYPADVADAAKWSKQHSEQKGDDAVKAVESQSWDPSVKSLAAFPQVLAMMGEKPDWVQSLGDAFLASSKDVLDAVQRLRAKAQEAGNLKSNEQQKVVVKQEPAQPQVIVIEAADPQVVYVPSYNPTVVYGTWPYPSYPPYYYPPPPAYYPGYALASGIAFGIGVAAVGSMWGNCNWGGGDVDIDVNRYNNVNRNNQINANQNRFQHNSANRRGVPYRDSRSQQQYGRNVPGAADRANFRGRDPARDSQRQRAQSTLGERGMDPGRGRDELRNNPRERDRAQNAARGRNDGGFDRNGLDRGNRENANRRDGAGAGNRMNSSRDRAGVSDRASASDRASRQTERARGGGDNAFRDAGNSGRTRQQTDRGSSSRQQMQRSGGGGRSMGGGGGGRSMGGGRGGGGGRR